MDKDEWKNSGTEVHAGSMCRDQHTNFSSQQITSRIPQGLILVALLFSTLINDLDNGTDCTINRFSDSKPNWGVMEHRVVVLDNNRLKKLTDEKLTGFNPRHTQSAAS